MEILLQKYYEYFLKRNIQNKNDELEFYNFYRIIINAYKVENDKQLKNDLKIFKNFFNPYNIYHNSKYLPEKIIERRKKSFYKENPSFDWFLPSEHLITNSHFIFSTPSTENAWAKIYLSIKPDSYIKTIIKLQEFIDFLDAKYNIENTGQIKFRTNMPANDAIVLRFAKKEHYEDFITFLEENKEIKNAFDTPNPFLPQDKYGLSIITDAGGSYNYFVTKIIWDYMFNCKDKNSNTNISELIQFIIEYNKENDPMIYKNGNKIIEDFKYVLISKLTNTNDLEIIENLFNQETKKYTKKI